MQLLRMPLIKRVVTSCAFAVAFDALPVISSRRAESVGVVPLALCNSSGMLMQLTSSAWWAVFLLGTCPVLRPLARMDCRT